MDSGYWKRSNCARLEPVWFVDKLENLIADLIVIGELSPVGSYEPLVNQLLTILLDMNPVCNYRDIKHHVSPKNERTRTAF